MRKIILLVVAVMMLFSFSARAHQVEEKECVKRWAGICVLERIISEAAQHNEEHRKEKLSIRWVECLYEGVPGDKKHEAYCTRRVYGWGDSPIRGARGWE